MIKAEVINHEGNPGPNWLDHCRTVFTPWTATLLLIVIAGTVTVIDIKRHDNTGSTANSANTSTQSQLPAYNESNSLQVAPPLDPAPTAAGTSAAPNTVQSASGVSTAPTTQQDSAAARSLGATTAPSSAVPTSNKASDTTSSPVTQNQLNARNLTNTLQSTLRSAQSVIDDTRSGITKGLNLKL